MPRAQLSQFGMRLMDIVISMKTVNLPSWSDGSCIRITLSR